MKLAPDRYDITVFGAEPFENYNRILLSSVLAGEKTIDDIMLNDEQWYIDNGITLHKGNKVVFIDQAARKVIGDDGTTTGYDRIILATGSHPFVIPVLGADLPGVITFRNILDVEALLHASTICKKPVVIGAGLLGLEAANGLVRRGMAVTVVHQLGTLMERQIDKPASDLLKDSLEQRGITVLTERHTRSIIGDTRVQGIRFTDGTVIEADLVVMAVGICPDTALAQSAGLHCERGIVVNDAMQTDNPRIYAVGECAQHRGVNYGLVVPLFEQAMVCAKQLAGISAARYEGSVVATTLKVTGIDIFSAGDFLGDADCEVIVLRDPGRHVYKKLVLRDNRLIGAVFFGESAASEWYRDLMREQTDIGPFRDVLMFGPKFMGKDDSPKPEMAA